MMHEEIRTLLDQVKEVNSDIGRFNHKACRLSGNMPSDTKHNKISRLLFFINNGYIESDTAEKLVENFSDVSEEDFSKLMLCMSSDKRYPLSIEELKKGLEEGLDIKELMLVIGTDPKETHEKIAVYSIYSDFFRNRLDAGYGNDIKNFLNSSLSFRGYIPKELVLYAHTIDDLETVAPVVKVSEQTYFQIENSSRYPDCAYYVALSRTSDNTEEHSRYFHCVSPDGETYESVNESDAASWVNKKNDSHYSRIKMQKRKIRVSQKKAMK